MNEAKTPKKPIAYFYAAAIIVIMVANLIIVPSLTQLQIKDVDYGTFMRMMEEKEIAEVKIEDNQITFADHEEKIYRTAPVSDNNLVERLYDSGAKFSGEIIKEPNMFANILLGWILPSLLMFVAGQYMFKKMSNKMSGGMDSMKFGMGKSNAKVYVKSTAGIKFSDVAGEDEAKEVLTEIVDYLHNPDKYREIGASMPKGALLVGP